jgi:2-polyprenyl-3-methyl-5-hydroxy-6-metoxy-1,4-benzoquinol methylase
MKITKTDRESSIVANEFVWDTSANTEVHTYVGPILEKWIDQKTSKTLLDLGCGNGALTAQLASLGIACTGTDYSETGIEIAQKNFPNVHFFQSAMEQPLPAAHLKKYDIVVSVEVIEHLLLPRQLFERAKEALNSNGTLIITAPYHGFWKNLALALTNKYDSHWHPLRDYGHVKFFSLKTLCQLFEEQGFIVDEIKRVGRIPLFARSMMVKGHLKK